ncbi:uncharacterized protein LOC125249500 [Megalobrama amblycephala]|uniref:uncharacterized protein LOC125249500 n=1 Tax=Megalobrama amblycephala TaxID=75352 RepID=UPI002014103F|nr:uncharacterized protein LOC125249500 [Megalobrama amblycephala]
MTTAAGIMSVEPQSCSSDVLEDDPPLSGAVVSASSGATDAMDRPPPPRVAWENNTTEKHTKKKNLIRSSWEAVKHPNQSQETKVCAFVPEQESEQELPHTSSVEPTDQKHTKKKNLIRRAWEAEKHPNQSQETKVCAFVPEQESEQELPHTSSVEPTDRESPVINTQNACVGLQKVRRKKRSPPKERRVPQDLTLPEIESESPVITTLIHVHFSLMFGMIVLVFPFLLLLVSLICSIIICSF